LFVFFDLCCVYVCICVIYIEFLPYCLFVSNSQVIGCEDRLRNDLYCVGWGVKLYSLLSAHSSPISVILCTLLSNSKAISPLKCSLHQSPNLTKPGVTLGKWTCWTEIKSNTRTSSSSSSSSIRGSRHSA